VKSGRTTPSAGLAPSLPSSWRPSQLLSNRTQSGCPVSSPVLSGRGRIGLGRSGIRSSSRRRGEEGKEEAETRRVAPQRWCEAETKAVAVFQQSSAIPSHIAVKSSAASGAKISRMQLSPSAVLLPPKYWQGSPGNSGETADIAPELCCELVAGLNGWETDRAGVNGLPLVFLRIKLE